jgi:hypothetical protein
LRSLRSRRYAPDECCGLTEEDFPLEESRFKICLDAFAEANKYNNLGLYYNRNGELAGLRMGLETKTKFIGAVQRTEEFVAMVDAFSDPYIKNNAELKGTGLDKGWYLTQLQLYDVQTSLANGVRQTLAVSLGTALLVLLVTTANIPITIVGMATISCILGGTIALLIDDGWKLSILESVVFSTAVGLSVDVRVNP